MLRRVAIIIGYTLLTGLVVLFTIGLVYYGRGYTYNFKEHRVVRTGLVILQSVPGGINVEVGNHTTKKKTTYRQSFEAGKSYTFSLAKTGYHTWSKTLKVIAGEVTLAQYVLLVPNDLHSQAILSTDSITSQSLSRDHRHLAYVATGANPGIYVYNFDNAKPTRIYTPAVASATASGESITSVEWSDDASHLLVISQLDDVTTAQVMTDTGTNVTNLTSQYRFDFSTLHFSGYDWRQLYWISPDGLRRLDLGSQSVSGVLADAVKQFETQDDRVFYVQVTATGPSLWALDRSGHKQELVAALPSSDRYSIAYTNYRGNDVLAVVTASTGVGTLYTNIFGDTPVAQTLAHNVSDVSFSPDGHVAIFSGAASVTSYDLEQSMVFHEVVSSTFGVSSLSEPPTWFDSFHLLALENGRLVWMEYDGANQVDLGSAASTLPAFGSADTRTVYVYQAKTSSEQLTSLTIRP